MIEKTITGGFQFFTTHRNSGRCKKAQRRELNRIPDTDGKGGSEKGESRVKCINYQATIKVTETQVNSAI
jgi:hypothetical protein